jgi:hypothetical protein
MIGLFICWLLGPTSLFDVLPIRSLIFIRLLVQAKIEVSSVPITILNQIDKYRRHCLWRGSDVNARKPPLVAWKMVTKPKFNEGLGVINLRRQNEVLLLKHIHK